MYRSEISDVPPDNFRLGLGRINVPDALKAMQNFMRKSAA
jgi:hypothetical protein